MSIFARTLQILLMVLGVASIGVGLIMILIANPHWYCEATSQPPGSSCSMTDLEARTSYHLFWFVLGLAFEIMAVAVAAGARCRKTENLLAAILAGAAPAPPMPSRPGGYPGFPPQPPYPGQ